MATFLCENSKKDIKKISYSSWTYKDKGGSSFSTAGIPDTMEITFEMRHDKFYNGSSYSPRAYLKLYLNLDTTTIQLDAKCTHKGTETINGETYSGSKSTSFTKDGNNYNSIVSFTITNIHQAIGTKAADLNNSKLSLEIAFVNDAIGGYAFKASYPHYNSDGSELHSSLNLPYAFCGRIAGITDINPTITTNTEVYLVKDSKLQNTTDCVVCNDNNTWADNFQMKFTAEDMNKLKQSMNLKTTQTLSGVTFKFYTSRSSGDFLFTYFVSKKDIIDNTNNILDFGDTMSFDISELSPKATSGPQYSKIGCKVLLNYTSGSRVYVYDNFYLEDKYTPLIRKNLELYTEQNYMPSIEHGLFRGNSVLNSKAQVLYCNEQEDDDDSNIDFSFYGFNGNQDGDQFVLYTYKVSYYDKINNKEVKIFEGAFLPRDMDISSFPEGLTKLSVATNEGRFVYSIKKSALKNIIKPASFSNKMTYGFFTVERGLYSKKQTSTYQIDYTNGSSFNQDGLIIAQHKTQINSNNIPQLEYSKNYLYYEDEKYNCRKSTYTENLNANKTIYIDWKKNKINYSLKNIYFKFYNNYKDSNNNTVGIHYENIYNNGQLTGQGLKIVVEDYIDGQENPYKEHTTYCSPSDLSTDTNLSKKINVNYNYINENITEYLTITKRRIKLSCSFKFSYFDLKNSTKSINIENDEKYYDVIFPLKTVFVNTSKDRFDQELSFVSMTPNEDYTTISIQTKYKLKDIGGCKTDNMAYDFNNQNFYDNRETESINQLTRRFEVTYNDEPISFTLKDYKTNQTLNATKTFSFKEKLSSDNELFNEDETEFLIKCTRADGLIGKIKIKVVYELLSGSYYNEEDDISIQSKSKDYTISTIEPTIYKRRFSVGINQYPADSEILRIEVPKLDGNKKYIALGNKLLIDLNEGKFYRVTDTLQKSETGRFYQVSTNNYVPYRKAIHGSSDYINKNKRYDYELEEIF